MNGVAIITTQTTQIRRKHNLLLAWPDVTW